MIFYELSPLTSFRKHLFHNIVLGILIHWYIEKLFTLQKSYGLIRTESETWFLAIPTKSETHQVAIPKESTNLRQVENMDRICNLSSGNTCMHNVPNPQFRRNQIPRGSWVPTKSLTCSIYRIKKLFGWQYYSLLF